MAPRLKDRVLTSEEFSAGIIGDTAKLFEEAFRTTRLDRMDGCITAAAAGAALSEPETASHTECTLKCQVVQLSPYMYFEILGYP